MQREFEDIYNGQAWGNGSGEGSHPLNTEPYRACLEQFIRDNGIKTILDIGCGDWQFSRLIDWQGADYTGLDCVPAVVAENVRRFGGERVRFIHADVAAMPFVPTADLVIIKDVLQHWPEAVVRRFIPKLQGSRNVLFVNCRTDNNGDIGHVGHFRPMNLELPPYGLPVETVLTWHTKAAQLWRPPAPWFAHSGDLGDILYALPAIRAAGGGTLYLYDTPGKTTHGMTRERADLIAPLLKLQPYIRDVVYCPDGHEDHALNGFRDHWQPGFNLTDMHSATMGFGREVRRSAWLRVDEPDPSYPVVFARSARYRNPQFPWREVWARYPQAVFVGTVAEHEAFCSEVGDVPHVATGNLLDVARIIAGCRLFVGNQSAPLAIAEGLRVNVIAEVCLSFDNCRSRRIGRIDATDADFELPEVDGDGR